MNIIYWNIDIVGEGEQGLATWEKVQDKAVERIHKVLTQSVFPACERLLLCLEDLIGWGME